MAESTKTQITQLKIGIKKVAVGGVELLVYEPHPKY